MGRCSTRDDGGRDQDRRAAGRGNQQKHCHEVSKVCSVGVALEMTEEEIRAAELPAVGTSRNIAAR